MGTETPSEKISTVHSEEESKAEEVKEEQKKEEEIEGQKREEERKELAKKEDQSERKKEVEDSAKEQDKSEEESEEEEAEAEAESDSAEKEPVTPSSDRPVRERKLVERYSAPSIARSSSHKPILIVKGSGTELKDIPNVAFKLSKRKADENLQMLHCILFGKKAKPRSLKRNIGKFSGYVWVENEEKQKAKMKEKIDKCMKEKLMDFCDLLNIPISRATAKKEELSAKLLEFLESPHATTDALLADKDQKGKKRKTTPGKNSGQSEESDMSSKKQKQTPRVEANGKPLSKTKEDEHDDNVESPDTKGDSHEGEDDDGKKGEGDDVVSKSVEKNEPQEKTNKKSASKSIAKDSAGSKRKEKSASEKKAAPAKSPVSPLSTKKSPSSSSKQLSSNANETSAKSKKSSSKKQKMEKECPKDERDSSAKQKGRSASKKEKSMGKKRQNSVEEVSSKGQGKASKKPKEPAWEEMHMAVVEILKEADFNTATLSDIIRQLGAHFGVDLMHRKAEVKDIITEVINNMSDEDDEDGDDPCYK